MLCSIAVDSLGGAGKEGSASDGGVGVGYEERLDRAAGRVVIVVAAGVEEGTAGSVEKCDNCVSGPGFTVV